MTRANGLRKALSQLTSLRIQQRGHFEGSAVAKRCFSAIGLGDIHSSNVYAAHEQEWRNPDAAKDPDSYIKYLDGIYQGMAPSGPAADYKRQVYDFMEIEAGDSIIVIGCGTGVDVLEIAELLSTMVNADNQVTGRVTGVDISEIMIAEAEQKFREKQEGIGSSRLLEKITVDFRVGNGEQLRDSIATDSYDICRSDRSLQHMSDPKSTLEEMVRIAKPGVGRIIVSEPDWETLVIDSPSNRATTRAIVNHFTNTRVNGWMGRQLFRLFQSSGLIDVKVVPMTCPVLDLDFIREAYLDKAQMMAIQASVVTKEEASRWMEELVALNKTCQFFSTLTIYCARGRLP